MWEKIQPTLLIEVCVVQQVSESGGESFPHSQSSHHDQRNRCSVGVPPQPNTYMTMTPDFS